MLSLNQALRLSNFRQIPFLPVRDCGTNFQPRGAAAGFCSQKRVAFLIFLSPRFGRSLQHFVNSLRN